MLLSRVSGWILGLFGWSAHAEFPSEEKYVVIVAPHTSNWDFILGLLAAWNLQIKAHWLGKHTIFRGPLGWYLRKIGGLPVERSKTLNVIQEMADSFTTAKRPILALAPEGTRARLEYWRTGFYHIARSANVPIALAYIDYPARRIALEKTLWPGEDIDQVFDEIRAFYAGHRGRYPEKESRIEPKRSKRQGMAD